MECFDCLVIKVDFEELPEKIIDQFVIIGIIAKPNVKTKCYVGSDGNAYTVGAIAEALGLSKVSLNVRAYTVGIDHPNFLKKKILSKDKDWKAITDKAKITRSLRKKSGLMALSDKPRTHKLKDI